MLSALFQSGVIIPFRYSSFSLYYKWIYIYYSNAVAEDKRVMHMGCSISHLENAKQADYLFSVAIIK